MAIYRDYICNYWNGFGCFYLLFLFLMKNLSEKQKKFINKFVDRLLKEYRGFFEMCAREDVLSADIEIKVHNSNT